MENDTLRFAIDCSTSWAEYKAEARSRGYTHTTTDTWSIPEKDEDRRLPVLRDLELLYSDRTRNGGLEGIYKGEGILANVELNDTQLTLYMSTNTHGAGDEVRQELMKLFPEAIEPKSDDAVYVNFWSHSPRGPQMVRRQISIIHWAENLGNYPPKVGMTLDPMLDPKWRPPAEGQLILWTGPPGTGKTYALRAMADSWRKWATTEYIIDPEMFLSDPTYMMSVLLGDQERVRHRRAGKIWDPDSDQWVKEKDWEEPWRLIVLEDTGELLAQDAKERTGQGLARLLNITDGLIGQGLRNLFLITTNEEIGKLHPAVVRPGRCLLNLKFEKFHEEQANEWLQMHGSDEKVDGSTTLAELFAKTRGESVPAKEELAGFRPT